MSKNQKCVCTRRKHDVLWKMSPGKEGILHQDLEVMGDCLGLEDHTFDSSSSDYSDSDKEVRDVEDTFSDHERGVAEEAGFEGWRSLLGSQVLEMAAKIASDDEARTSKRNSVRFENKERNIESFNGFLDREGDQKNLIEGEGEVKRKNPGQQGQGEMSMVVRPTLKVGKIGFLSNEIKAVSNALDLQLIEIERVIENKRDKHRNSRNSALRKGGDRELYSLKCTIDYEKGKKEKGHQSDS